MLFNEISYRLGCCISGLWWSWKLRYDMNIFVFFFLMGMLICFVVVVVVNIQVADIVEIFNKKRCFGVLFSCPDYVNLN